MILDGAASEEDGRVGGRIRLGTAELDLTKQIDRCVMTTRPQPGGLERDLSVLKTINAERAGLAAIGALVTQPGRITVGDVVTPRTDSAVAHLVRPVVSRTVSQAARQLPKLDRLRRHRPRQT